MFISLVQCWYDVYKVTYHNENDRRCNINCNISKSSYVHPRSFPKHFYLNFHLYTYILRIQHYIVPHMVKIPKVLLNSIYITHLVFRTKEDWTNCFGCSWLLYSYKVIYCYLEFVPLFCFILFFSLQHLCLKSFVTVDQCKKSKHFLNRTLSSKNDLRKTTPSSFCPNMHCYILYCTHNYRCVNLINIFSKTIVSTNRLKRINWWGPHRLSWNYTI